MFQNQQEDSSRPSFPAGPRHALPQQKGAFSLSSALLPHTETFQTIPLPDYKEHRLWRSLSFLVDDSEGAAGVEDSSLHLQLEERQGNMTPPSTGPFVSL